MTSKNIGNVNGGLFSGFDLDSLKGKAATTVTVKIPVSGEKVAIRQTNKALAGAGVEMIGIDHRETLLKQALDTLSPRYDYILIDCPPSLEMLTVNALCAAGSLLAAQTALNVFGAMDLLPLTGVTLPFVSNGGSAMIASWGLLAFLRGADTRERSRRAPAKKEVSSQ